MALNELFPTPNFLSLGSLLKCFALYNLRHFSYSKNKKSYFNLNWTAADFTRKDYRQIIEIKISALLAYGLLCPPVLLPWTQPTADGKYFGGKSYIVADIVRHIVVVCVRNTDFLFLSLFPEGYKQITV